MATLQQIIYTVANMRKNWLRTDDDSMTDRQYAFIIDYYRAKLLKQQADSGKTVSSYLIQNLGKVTLVKADKNECCEVNDCILRVENPVPKTIDTNGNNLITYVGLLNGSKSFQKTTYNRVIHDANARYTSKQPKWYEQGKYIYIVNPPSNLLKYINIQGVFENPTEAYQFRTCVCLENDEVGCFNGFDYEYPMSITMLDAIYKMMADAEFKFASVLTADTTNNTKDD
jgi:hypothetical protein